MRQRAPVRAGLTALTVALAFVAPHLRGAEDDLAARAEAATGGERVDLLVELADRLRNSDAAHGERSAREAATLADQLGDATRRARARTALASNLNVLGRNEEALAALAHAVEDARAAAEPKLEALALRRKGVVHYDRGEYDTALEAYRAALALFESAGEPIEVARTSANIGNVLYTRGDNTRAREFQERALELFTAAGDRLGQAGTSLNLASTIHSAASDFEEGSARQNELLDAAAAANRRALELFRALGVPRGEASALSNLGRLAARRGDLAGAIALQREALELRRKVGDQIGQSNSLEAIGGALTRLGRHDQARAALDEALALAREAGSASQEAIVQNALAGIAERRGDFEGAVRALRAKDAAEEREQQQEANELTERFESERKQREIVRLEQEQRIRELEIARARLWRNGGFAGAAFALALLGLVWSRYRLSRRMAGELERLARTDVLTGLANRRALIDELAAELSRARRSGRPLAVAIADLDDFKRVNDRLGHDAGDRALAAVAARLRATLRSPDLVGRWGGEEFLVLLPETDLEGALRTADRLRTAIAETPFALGTGEISLSLTIGVAALRDSDGADALVARADAALLDGKGSGKDRTVAEAAAALAGDASYQPIP